MSWTLEMVSIAHEWWANKLYRIGEPMLVIVDFKNVDMAVVEIS